MIDWATLLPLVLVVALVIEIAWSIYSAHWLAKRYSHRLVESLFFRRLVRRNKRVAYVGGGIIGIIAVYGLLSFVFPVLPQVPRPYPAVAVIIALMLMIWGPIDDKRVIEKIDRERSDGTPPPFRAGD